MWPPSISSTADRFSSILKINRKQEKTHDSWIHLVRHFILLTKTQNTQWPLWRWSLPQLIVFFFFKTHCSNLGLGFLPDLSLSLQIQSHQFITASYREWTFQNPFHVLLQLKTTAPPWPQPQPLLQLALVREKKSDQIIYIYIFFLYWFWFWGLNWEIHI